MNKSKSGQAIYTQLSDQSYVPDRLLTALAKKINPVLSIGLHNY